MSLKSAAVFRRLGTGLLLLALTTSNVFAARDAAFMDPGAAGSTGDGAVRVEPKAEIETGESVLNVARRTTLFFVNQTNQPLKIEKLTVNGDGNVITEIANDDCSKQGSIPAASRCSVEVSATPTSPGPWNVDVLMTHDGAGRIARAKIIGKTSGTIASGDKKESGLAVSNKDVAPVNFGDVEVGGKAVRSALMVNDSPEPITLYSIDVIEAGSGLIRLEQGCAIDMELKQGESCPVTLVWSPQDRGQISTDLIIRHSGRLGFAVIPIRGNAKGGTAATGTTGATGRDASRVTFEQRGNAPLPPSPSDLASIASGNVAPLSSEVLGSPPPEAPVSAPSGTLRLIGTVGNRVVLLLPDGTTAVVGAGEEFEMGSKKGRVTAIMGKSADVMIDGKKKNLTLAPAPELTRASSSQTGVDSSYVPGASSPSPRSSLGNSVPLPGASATASSPPTLTPAGVPPSPSSMPPSASATPLVTNPGGGVMP
ncbi:MAG: hypothetical protein WAO98_09545 [Alphaproteobacteria bacterium]